MTATYKDERMLVIAPHHDDAEFGLGGWMARAGEEEVGEFRVVVLAHGGYTRSDGKAVSSSVREAESDRSLQLLKAKHRYACSFLENRALDYSYPDLVQLIADEIDAYQATEVFVPLPSFNQDHRVVHDACVTELRPGARPSVRCVWAYGYPGNCWGPQAPDIGKSYIVLKEHHAMKKKLALDQHASQWAGRTLPVSPDTAMHQMRLWGAECGAEWAEVLWMLREVHR